MPLFSRRGERHCCQQMRLLPEAAKRRLEDFNHDLGRRTLKLGLGKDPARWGFKAMA